MAAAVVLVLGPATLGVISMAVRILATAVVITLSLAVLFAVAVYGLCFLGFYFIFGIENVGWAIFAAMFLGSLLMSQVVRKSKLILRIFKVTSHAEQ